MRSRRSRAYRRGRIEIIPMIDVMFFLLATFMLASLSMQSINSLKVNLPKGEAAQVHPQRPVTLTVTRKGELFLNRTPVTLDNLTATLKSMLKDHERSVIVNADRAALNGVVVSAMLEARQAGAQDLLIAVKRP